MKINKWTLGLAALGLVSLGSAQAEEKAVPLMTALSSTTLGGYIDTSINWKPGTGNALPATRTFDGTSKQDGFNVNVVSLELSKPLDEGQWSAGYRVQTILGPDAVTRGTRSIIGGQSGDIALHEAYVALRAPVGNGLDFKLGQWATPIGYESFDGYKNPNYSRSYAFALEPATHTGLLAEYVLSDMLAFKAGVANSISTPIDARSSGESVKTYLGMVTVTAPEAWGFLKGSTISLGYVNGPGHGSTKRGEDIYAGITLATPVAGLSLGAAYDHFEDTADVFGAGTSHGWAGAIYASFAASEKLKLNARGEYVNGDPGLIVPSGTTDNEILALTLTADYALWQNVITRGEVRWDTDLNGSRPFGTSDHSALTLALNVIYKF
jgi:hypothetical protein